MMLIEEQAPAEIMSNMMADTHADQNNIVAMTFAPILNLLSVVLFGHIGKSI